MLIAQRGERTNHSVHIAIMHRHKRAIAVIVCDPLQAYLHLQFRRLIPQLAHELGKRRRIVHLGYANRKIEESVGRQGSARSKAAKNPCTYNYVETDSGAPPLIPTKPSRSKCKMIS